MKITKTETSLKQLSDIDTTGGSRIREDNIKHNQILMAHIIDDGRYQPKVFRFKNLSSVINAGSGITVTESNGEITISSTGGGSGVPYTGATGNVDLGEYELKAGQIEFDQTPTGTAGVAVMRWNDTDGTVDVGLKGGNVTLQVGQEQLARVVNKVGSDLLEANYQAVRVRLVSEGGAAGQRLAVVLAQANNDTNSATTIGIVTETILNNQEGFVTTSGVVREINTTGSLQGETWVDGDILYLSGTTAGQLTNIKPSAPTHTIIIGFVEYAHAIHGKIFVKVDNGYEIDELHNVNAQNPLDDDIIVYSSGTTLWEKKNIYTAIKTKRDYLITGNQTTTSNLASAVTELVYSASANKRYSVSGYIRIGCNNTGGVRLSVTIPSGASMAIALNGISNSGTSLLYSNINISNTLTGGAYNTFNGTSIINVSGEVELSSTAGNIQFNFASTTNLQTSTIYQLGTLLNFVEL